MLMKFLCERCGNEYSRPTYTASASKNTKEYWRKLEGTKYGLCEDCYKIVQEEKRQAEAKKAMDESKEIGLPELTGSEKQIAWASQIRLAFLKELDRPMPDILLRCKEYLFKTKTTAKFWIDNRELNIKDLLILAHKEQEAVAEQEAYKEPETDTTIVAPEKPIMEIPAEITYNVSEVKVKSQKNENIIKLLKDDEYKWDPQNTAWIKKLGIVNGNSADRAAEIANKLLNIGVPVKIANEIKDIAIKATYEPEWDRWIVQHGDDTDHVYIYWKGHDDDLYNKARRLPGARYKKPYVIVSVKHFTDIAEFARLYEFKLSTGANKLIENYKKSIVPDTVAVPAEPLKIIHEDGLKKILESSNEVIENLKDD